MRFERINSENGGVLRELMYQALYVAPGSDPFPLSILEQTDIKRYYHSWGQTGDIGITAWSKGELVGGAWCRLFDEQQPGYGFYNSETPEMVVAVNPEFRNLGIGTQLINRLKSELINEGFTGISLSVQKTNPAIKLYLRLGFQLHLEDEGACTMIANLVT